MVWQTEAQTQHHEFYELKKQIGLCDWLKLLSTKAVSGYDMPSTVPVGHCWYLHELITLLKLKSMVC